MHPVDLDQFRAKRNSKPPPAKLPQPPRHKVGEWFLRGPIPGAWLTRTTGLSFRALRVGLALWYLAGLTKSRKVKPTGSTWKRFNLSPDAGRRGLAALEHAGLVTVDRPPGRCPVVTIQETAPDQKNLDLA
jgi:hypothetical protein